MTFVGTVTNNMSAVDKKALHAMCLDPKLDTVLRLLDATASKEEAAELLFDVDNNVLSIACYHGASLDFVSRIIQLARFYAKGRNIAAAISSTGARGREYSRPDLQSLLWK